MAFSFSKDGVLGSSYHILSIRSNPEANWGPPFYQNISLPTWLCSLSPSLSLLFRLDDNCRSRVTLVKKLVVVIFFFCGHLWWGVMYSRRWKSCDYNWGGVPGGESCFLQFVFFRMRTCGGLKGNSDKSTECARSLHAMDQIRGYLSPFQKVLCFVSVWLLIFKRSRGWPMTNVYMFIGISHGPEKVWPCDDVDLSDFTVTSWYSSLSTTTRGFIDLSYTCTEKAWNNGARRRGEKRYRTLLSSFIGCQLITWWTIKKS